MPNTAEKLRSAIVENSASLYACVQSRRPPVTVTKYVSCLFSQEALQEEKALLIDFAKHTLLSIKHHDNVVPGYSAKLRDVLQECHAKDSAIEWAECITSGYIQGALQDLLAGTVADDSDL